MAEGKVDWQLEANQRNLREKTLDQLEQLYPDIKRDSLRRYQTHLLSGLEVSPLRQEIIDEQVREKLHKSLDEVIDKANIDPDAIRGFRIEAGEYEQGSKHPETGEVTVTKLNKHSVKIIADAKDFVAKWPVVDRAPYDVTFNAPKVVKTKGDKIAVVLPDPQIGFLQYEDGTLDPFHDNSAISIALQIINDVQPDVVVCLGDFLDLPVAGTYEQSPEFARTTQKAINYGFKLLAKIRAMVPNAEIAVIEGNHDRRMEKSLKRNAMWAYGLRRADDMTGWPALSVPYLCGFDALHIKYVEGYPAGNYWLNDRLQMIHGHLVDSAGSTAKKVSLNERVSTIFGHIHRVEAHYKTVSVRDGGRTNAAFSPGCLCRIDGAVPSAKGSTDLNGRPIRHYEDWQQGLAVVNYKEGDGAFNYQQVFINTLQNYETSFNGKLYKPALKLIDKD